MRTPSEAKTSRTQCLRHYRNRPIDHTLTSDEDNTAKLSMLCDFDDDLATTTTQITNRFPNMLTHIYPHLEHISDSNIINQRAEVEKQIDLSLRTRPPSS